MTSDNLPPPPAHLMALSQELEVSYCMHTLTCACMLTYTCDRAQFLGCDRQLRIILAIGCPLGVQIILCSYLANLIHTCASHR